MTIYIYSIIIMSLMVLISLTNYRKIVRYVNVIILMLLTMLNTNKMDFNAYVSGYNNPNIYSKTMELGYRLMCNLLKGVGFNDFRIVLVLLAFLLVYTLTRVLRDKIDQLNIVSLVFFVFAFVYFIIQIRNSFMLLMLINCVYSIYERKYKRAVVEGILSIGFHIMAIGYIVAFVCLFYLFKKGNNQFKFISIRNTIFLLAVYIFGRIYPILINYIGSFSNHLIAYKYKFYLREFEGISGWVFVTLMDLFLFYLLGNCKLLDENAKRKTNIFYLFLLIELPALFFLQNFNEIGRLYRDMFLLKAIFCASLSGSIENKYVFILYSYSLLSGVAIIMRLGINLDGVFGIMF